MYHRVRRKMQLVVCAITILLILVPNYPALPTIDNAAPETKLTTEPIDNYENNVIDFDDEYSVKFNHKYEVVPWRTDSERYVKDSHRYTIVKDDARNDTDSSNNKTETIPMKFQEILNEPTTETDFSVIPLELVSTTENYLISIIESTTEQDLSVIPLSSTVRSTPSIEINQTVTLPTSTQESETTTDISRESVETTTGSVDVTTTIVQTTLKEPSNQFLDIVSNKSDVNISLYVTNDHSETTTVKANVNHTKAVFDKDLITSENLSKSDTTTVSSRDNDQSDNVTMKDIINDEKVIKIEKPNEDVMNKTTTHDHDIKLTNNTDIANITANNSFNKTVANNDTSINNGTTFKEILVTNSTKQNENVTVLDSIEVDEKDVPIFTELDAGDEEVPEDYYDSKDVVTTPAPKTNALSVLVGLAGSVVESVVESVAERVVPKGIFDLFKRMQRQSEALEAERLRSREENGGLGQFGRGILKSISTGLSKPLSQLMAGAKDIGSLDSDRGFVSSLASGVTSVATVATSLGDAFKDRVQAIYPGTVWCGDGHSATARSGELGLFFFTDTCCRQHDACKIYIRAGDTKYGLTNTGLFTRSHCSCDAKFRECLHRTNSLVSAQIGLTYFNVLGPQCFRRAHPIVRCLKRTRITGQKCEEYEFDYTKPKMWQWFDNETF